MNCHFLFEICIWSVFSGNRSNWSSLPEPEGGGFARPVGKKKHWPEPACGRAVRGLAAARPPSSYSSTLDTIHRGEGALTVTELSPIDTCPGRRKPTRCVDSALSLPLRPTGSASLPCGVCWVCWDRLRRLARVQSTPASAGSVSPGRRRFSRHQIWSRQA